MFLFSTGYDACRYFEVNCDPKLEECEPMYLKKGMVYPGKYKCVCKKGFQKLSNKKCGGKYSIHVQETIELSIQRKHFASGACVFWVCEG